ncbi:urease accessory protein UreF [Brachybacterium saurashtrense]|uniref:Urease accessory protein UreF n=1 Tax=Brachybacterium saurashtrense TaxID=556288 RepID=A0A345YJX6_9MICO|nr:urease accessory UreF family protein [Brachybacterium saurashtrense]AXK44228.1 urease accessory protein UreF [Brachybacterium saurashtrense]RRR21500.1 urease accessory protein UreF [Brachybacterium saurashtrense]
MLTTAPATPLASTTLAMLLADSRLPAGAHVASGALEAALRDGLDPAATGDYLAGRMATVVPVEAGTAVLARHLALHGGDLEALREEWAARTPSRALREVAVALGDGLRRLAQTLWPAALPPPPPGTGPWPRPIVLGLIAASAGLEAADLVRLIAYDDAQTVAAALLKLEPGDPREAAALVLEACALLEPRVAELAALTDPAHIPCAGAPLIDGWAEAQSQLPRRLFRA